MDPRSCFCFSADLHHCLFRSYLEFRKCPRIGSTEQVLPDILTGLRTAVGVSYATLVAAEMIASASGLAWMVLDASKYIQYATVYAGIFIMGGIALLIDGGLKLLIRKAMPWQETI